MHPSGMQGCGRIFGSSRGGGLVLLAVGAISGCGWPLMVASVAAIRAGGAGASVTYYVEQVARDRHDYYAGHGEAPGTWHGAFAEHLGLSGEVTAEDSAPSSTASTLTPASRSSRSRIDGSRRGM